MIILSFFVNNNELGKYSLAQKIGFLLRMIPVFITQSVLQIASRKNNNDKKSLEIFLNNLNQELANHVTGILMNLQFLI